MLSLMTSTIPDVLRSVKLNPLPECERCIGFPSAIALPRNDLAC